jgi:lysophospholipid acyltransferase (LPLAT)-like uncharacterized protein
MPRPRRLGTRILLLLLPPILRFALRALGVTWRFQIRGGRYFRMAVRSPRPVIGAALHGRLFALTYRCARPDWRPWRVLVSGSRDGEMIARVNHGMGLDTARGSSGRGGTRGYLEMVRSVKAEPHKALGFLVDGGGRGPRGQVKLGAIRLAKSTGAWIVPTVVSARPAFLFTRSWDRFMIPLPFARVAITFLPPQLVLGHGEAAYEAARQRLEQSLCSGQTRLDAEIGLGDDEPVRARIGVGRS